MRQVDRKISLSDYYRSTNVHSPVARLAAWASLEPLPSPSHILELHGRLARASLCLQDYIFFFAHLFQSLLTQTPPCLPDQAVPECAISSGPSFQAHSLLSVPESQGASTSPKSIVCAPAPLSARVRGSFTLRFPGELLVFRGQDTMSLCQFPEAAVTKHHGLGGLNGGNVSSQNSGGWTPEFIMCQGWFPEAAREMLARVSLPASGGLLEIFDILCLVEALP